jgi:uncharacterized protein YejL (UPF0352 family)
MTQVFSDLVKKEIKDMRKHVIADQHHAYARVLEHLEYLWKAAKMSVVEKKTLGEKYFDYLLVTLAQIAAIAQHCAESLNLIGREDMTPSKEEDCKQILQVLKDLATMLNEHKIPLPSLQKGVVGLYKIEFDESFLEELNEFVSKQTDTLLKPSPPRKTMR